MYSTIGRHPVIVDPIAIPEKPASAIGASTTRSGPNSSNIPFEALYAPLYSATSSPIKNIDSSRRISSLIASAITSLNVFIAILCDFVLYYIFPKANVIKNLLII